MAAASATPGPSGLGRLTVQSALGEPLRAEIDITSITPEEASSLRVRVASPEAYRAAGVDYNAVLPVDPGHACAARRRPAVSARDQRPRGPGALRRRDPRAHLVLRPPGARIHAAARSAGSRAWRRRRRRTAPVAPQASAAPPAAAAPAPAPATHRCSADRAAGGCAGAAAGSVIARHRRSRSSGAGRRVAERRRRVQGARRRHAVPHRQAEPARRRVARPDAGRAVPRQPAAPSSTTT